MLILHFTESVLYVKLNPIHTVIQYLHVAFFSHLHPHLVRSLLPRGSLTTFLNIKVGYSGSKNRLRVSLAHPRDCHFAHVQ